MIDPVVVCGGKRRFRDEGGPSRASRHGRAPVRARRASGSADDDGRAGRPAGRVGWS
jgi:hypothetical protein